MNNDPASAPYGRAISLSDDVLNLWWRLLRLSEAHLGEEVRRCIGPLREASDPQWDDVLGSWESFKEWKKRCSGYFEAPPPVREMASSITPPAKVPTWTSPGVASTRGTHRAFLLDTRLPPEQLLSSLSAALGVADEAGSRRLPKSRGRPPVVHASLAPFWPNGQVDVASLRWTVWLAERDHVKAQDQRAIEDPATVFQIMCLHKFDERQAPLPKAKRQRRFIYSENNALPPASIRAEISRRRRHANALLDPNGGVAKGQFPRPDRKAAGSFRFPD